MSEKDEIDNPKARKGITSIDGKSYKGKQIDYKSASLFSTDGSTNIVIDMAQAFGSAMITEFDYAYNMYVLVEELADPCPIVATEVTLRKYDTKGNQIGVAVLPIEDYVTHPNKPVFVSDNGNAYFMVPTADAVTIYESSFNNTYISTLAARRDSINQKAYAEMGLSAFATYIGNPLSRSTTRSRAIQMCDYSWTWNPTKFDYYPNSTTLRNSTNDPRATQLSATSSHSTTGIPYLWGGWDSFWGKTDGAPWTTFGAALPNYASKGPIVSDCSSAGTVLVNGNGAGIDCSGFVSAAVWTYSFSGSKPGTGDIQTNSLAVNDVVGNSSSWMSYSGLQPMDIFIESGVHVLFYDYRKLDGTGLYTLESTTEYGNISGDNTKGAKRYAETWSYLSGKTHRTWWTKQTGDDFNLPFTSTGSYTTIKGQGQYFRFTYNGSLPQSVTVTATPSVGDVDLYIYNSGYGLIGKSERGGTQSDFVTWTAVPGNTYYALTHCYVDASYSITKSW